MAMQIESWVSLLFIPAGAFSIVAAKASTNASPSSTPASRLWSLLRSSEHLSEPRLCLSGSWQLGSGLTPDTSLHCLELGGECPCDRLPLLPALHELSLHRPELNSQLDFVPGRAGGEHGDIQGCWHLLVSCSPPGDARLLPRALLQDPQPLLEAMQRLDPLCLPPRVVPGA